MIDFEECFRQLTGDEKPFHWQKQLFGELLDGRFRESCDMPTGLGKTSVTAIWLLALGQSLIDQRSPRRIPIRLVYVVDRRVIVDQSTEEAKRAIYALEKAESIDRSHNPLYVVAKALRRAALVMDGPLVALSALRGQMAENREWCLDPSRPAIIIGTVDMVGSRLLFSGYGGVGRSHRSLQAGLIGQDTLVVIDEAHLSPTFVGTVGDIKQAVHHFKLICPFEVMSLSATIPTESREANNDLQEEPLFNPKQELKNDEARDRLNAKKYIEWVYFDQLTKDKKATRKEIEEQMATAIVERAAQYEGQSLSIVMFVSTVGLVNYVAERIIEKLGDGSAERILKMTGEMRGFERDQLTENDKFRVFMPYRVRNASRPTHYLIATSCAEVGVNLDADHGICDLTSLDRMIQRIGRINRFGKTTATITVVVDRSAMNATESDIEREKSYLQQLQDSDKQVENVEKRVKDLKEEIRALKEKDEKAALKKNIKTAEAELKSAKDSRKKIEKEGVKYDEQFEDVDRIDRTIYYTWLALKSRENGEGKTNASPLALRELPRDLKAWPSPPVRPPLDSARLDDWSMTSLCQAEFRRPLVTYWLRGVTADETVQTTFCWRADLNYAASLDQAEGIVRAIPVAPRERAVLTTFRAKDVVEELATRWPDKLVVMIDPGGEYEAIAFRDLIEDRNTLFGRLAYATVVIPNKLGGLSGDGNVLNKLLKTSTAVPDVVDEGEWTRYAVRKLGDGDYECGKLKSDGDITDWAIYANLKEVIRRCAEESGGICINSKELQKAFANSASESEEPEVHEESQLEVPRLIAYFLNQQSSQHYLREADDMASLGMERGRTVDEHDADVERYVTAIARKIGLDEQLIEAVGIAGRRHDRGKKRDWWQAAIGNPKTDNKDWQPLAKSTHKSFDNNVNRNYRHEFGSLVETEADVELKEHPHRDLIMHLISAHHGYARPHFPSEAFDRAQPTAVSRKIAEEVMQRFANLQRKYGWWQLAYLEAVLKAADALASRDFDRGRL
ncbi:MAG: type I-U CRISPR-associated helicase/endonuclease Cas3 [Nitrospira sp.]|nr:type I-U CRISPR-associated helicase/endonuclease Cas3 [Nitrospira sp.]